MIRDTIFIFSWSSILKHTFKAFNISEELPDGTSNFLTFLYILILCTQVDDLVTMHRLICLPLVTRSSLNGKLKMPCKAYSEDCVKLKFSSSQWFIFNLYSHWYQDAGSFFINDHWELANGNETK
jgi:hypothetical protein